MHLKTGSVAYLICLTKLSFVSLSFNAQAIEIRTDNLGNHKAEQTLNMNQNFVSGDGDDEGLFVTGHGYTGIGTNNPQSKLHIQSQDRSATDVIFNVVNSYGLNLNHIQDNGKISWFVQDIPGTTIGGMGLSTPLGAPAFSLYNYDPQYSGSNRFAIRHLGNQMNIGFYYWDRDSLMIGKDGNVGIGISSPTSALQVDGYLHLAASLNSPSRLDCDETTEVGRMKVSANTNNLYVCTSSGWTSK